MSVSAKHLMTGSLTSSHSLWTLLFMLHLHYQSFPDTSTTQKFLKIVHNLEDQNSNKSVICWNVRDRTHPQLVFLYDNEMHHNNLNIVIFMLFSPLGTTSFLDPPGNIIYIFLILLQGCNEVRKGV